MPIPTRWGTKGLASLHPLLGHVLSTPEFSLQVVLSLLSEFTQTSSLGPFPWRIKPLCPKSSHGVPVCSRWQEVKQSLNLLAAVTINRATGQMSVWNPGKIKMVALGHGWRGGQGQFILCHHVNIQHYKEFMDSTVQLALRVNMKNVYQYKCMEYIYSILHLLDIQLLSI